MPEQRTRDKTPDATFEAVPPVTTLTVDEQERLWRLLVEGVGKVSKFTKAYFSSAKGYYLPQKRAYLISFDQEDGEDRVILVNNSHNTALIKKVLAEMGVNADNIIFTVNRGK